MSTGGDRLAEWRELLDDQPKSGLSIKEWCESEGFSTTTYYYWRKRLSEQPSSTEAMRSPQWLAVASADAPSASSALTLRVGQVSIEVSSGFDAALLGKVLGVLESRAC